MNVACAIFLYTTTDERFLWLTTQLIDSIRKYDDLPIYVLAPNKQLTRTAIDVLNKRDIPIWYGQRIVQNSWLPYELTKIEILKHIEYDKILLLDADCRARRSMMEIFDFPCVSAPCREEEPFQAGKILFKPDLIDHENLVQIIKSGFHPATGWDNFGPLKHWITGENTYWTFNGAEQSQGLLYYYYHILKNEYHCNQLDAISHRGQGHKKWKTDIVPRPKLL